VIKPWPPLTWNNTVSGFFMLIFGTMVGTLGARGFSRAATRVNNPEASFEAGGIFGSADIVAENAGFLDTFLGRGVMCIYLALRIMPLGQSYCMLIGFWIFFFGMGNIITHVLVWVGRKKACLMMNYYSTIIGAMVIGAGGMGMYWGVKVLRPWPPLTWNNFVSALFMFIFGCCVLILSIMSNHNPENGMYIIIKENMGFLDVFWGRGAMFIYLALRLMSLGSFYCLMSGFVCFGFGALCIALHFLWNVKSMSDEAQAAQGKGNFAQEVFAD